ncbi:inverse autotransporter beta domain-containing protein [bacterium endosymbiont of Bathymodiolus sp. 5 South]|uniref:inverse autotransporter beta domain-containing protein n=1 Tax=bacterium endosymbiont of Bathymodiolus sp. 5 South TaxID=1181670 RepID=UPI0015D5CD46|nr:inverse autotransporter beta domain-containing protein [bacterium endosymbiont of Bathymodiolus sp. 5 South]
MTSIIIKTQLTHCFNNTFSKTSTLIPIVNIARGVLSSGLDKLKRFLALSLLTTLSFNVFAVDNPQQLNKAEFNKAAYLDLSKPYNGNNPQPVSKKYNQATTLLKEVAGTVRNALGSTNSDNADQLGNKITTGISNQLKNQAANKTEGLINSKANKLLNKFGAGRSEVSIGGISSKKLSYNIDTIQPLSEFNSKIKTLTFIQGSLFNSENEGSRRNTLNLGLGHRMLVEDDRAIVGINIFTDYEINSKHKRTSLGLEYQRSNFSLTANKYHPLSNKVVIGDYTEEALSGHDIKVTGQIPYIPWAKIKGTHYYWDQSAGGSINGSILGVEVQLSPSSSIEFGQEDSNTMEHSGYAKLNLSFPFNTNEKMTSFAFDKKAFRDSTRMDLTLLEMVERSQQIKIEKLLNKHAIQSATSATIAEDTTGTYTIVLDSEPTSDVTIRLTSSDTTAATVTPLLTFTTSNWSRPQTITITAENDNDTDNETVIISYAISGGGYDTVSMANFTATMIDNDTAAITQLATAAVTQLAISATAVVAGVTQSATVMIMSEGRTGAYTIVLNSEPEGDVTIRLTSSDIAVATVTRSLTFTTSNWSRPQTITITAVNDPDMDNETVAIRHVISGGGYGSVSMSDIKVRIIDRTPSSALKSIIQSTTTVDIGENTTDTYTVVLDADPTGDVVIAMTSSDTNIVTVTPSLTFTTNNWATPQIVTVTSVRDINVDKVVYVSHTVTGSGYNAVTMSDVLVHVSDIPVEFVQVCNFWFFVCFGWQLEEVKPQSIIQSATSATIAETATGTYTIVLGKKPTSDVTIRLTSSDTTAATVTPLLTFTRRNWSRPQMVTVTGVNDNDAVRETVIISHAISGGGYDTVSMASFTATMIDDDTAGITQSVTSATIAESATATYTVVLDSEPTSDVTIRLTSSDTTAATVTPVLTFTRRNWSRPQMVTVTGVNDGDTDNETVVISHAISGGGYDALSMTNFTATMIDDDITFKGLSYTLITSPDTGRIWLDRNLGATRVATSSTDSAAYGYSYQWGRNDDGHESRTSGITTTRATTIAPAHNNYIFNNITYYWTSADSNGALRAAAWADGGSNDICPVGFSVPTEAELAADTISATTTTIINKDTAFSSFLKIPVAGYRNTDNVFNFVDAHIFLWTRSASGSISRYLTINSGVNFYNSYRAYAMSVRCIKS